MIALLSRAPVAGACKTRLIPRLGRRGAARLQARLLERALACAGGLELRLWAEPTTRHAAFLTARRRLGTPLARQPGGDLGRRMVRVLNRELGRGGPAILIGSDALDLQSEDLKSALSRLADDADFVIQPSTDGGYVLIGTRRRLPAGCLNGVAWSSGREAAQTIARLQRIGRVAVLPLRRDLDDARDWLRARRDGLIGPLPGR